MAMGQDMVDMMVATTVTIQDQAEDYALDCSSEEPHLLVVYLEAGQDETERQKYLILLKKLWNDWYCTVTAITFESHKFPFTDLLF